MSLRNQPYLPLYVQDFLTDEKLIECSAESTGVYIRLMCIMHKSEEYGAILLKQKDKQSEQQVKNFSLKLAKQLPYEIAIIEKSLIELIEENVIEIQGDKLIQKRMIRDNNISEKRAVSGSIGGKKTTEKNNKFAKANKQAKVRAKKQANSEYEIEYEIEDESSNKKKDIVLPYPLEEFFFSETLAGKVMEWLTYKQEKKDPYKPTGFKSLLRTIKAQMDKHGERVIIDLIDLSMTNNWKGIIWDRLEGLKLQKEKSAEGRDVNEYQIDC